MYINMKRLEIELGKERQCHITKQLVHSFPVNSMISQPSQVMFTEALTDPDVNQKNASIV